MGAASISYAGACHCGAIGYSYRTALAPPDWAVRTCGCRFCRVHAPLNSSDPAGSVAFHQHQPGALRRYRFGHRSADFLLCRDCGAYLGAVMQGAAGPLAVLNLNVLDPFPAGLPPATAMDFGDESPQQRIARRERHWTPVLALPDP